MSAPALPRNHDEYEALAVAWAISALEPTDQAIFEAHWAGCEDCARIVDQALGVAAELAYGVPDAAPPPALRGRLLADAAATTQDRTARPEPVSRQSSAPGGGRSTAVTAPEHRLATRGIPTARRQDGADSRGPSGAPRPAGNRWLRGRRRVLAALVAAVLVGGSAVTTWQIARSEQAPADRVAALSSGAGTVATVVAHQQGADVVTDALPPNDGTAYYVWGVPAGGDPQVVGTFVVTGTGLHSYPMRLVRSLSRYPVLAVSQERAGSSPTAPSSVIGKGALGG